MVITYQPVRILLPFGISDIIDENFSKKKEREKERKCLKKS